jgi:hypothetical protein
MMVMPELHHFGDAIKIPGRPGELTRYVGVIFQTPAILETTRANIR